MRRREQYEFQKKVVCWCLALATLIIVIALYTQYVEQRTERRLRTEIQRQVLHSLEQEAVRRHEQYRKELSK